MCALGTDLRDPLARLETIHDQMSRNKSLMADLGPRTAALYSMANMAPSLIASVPGMPRFPRPSFNLVISNVPGVRKELYYNGCAMTDLYPVSVVLDGQGLNMTMVSYLDTLEFGFVGCARLVPHLQRLLLRLENGIEDLEKAAMP